MLDWLQNFARNRRKKDDATVTSFVGISTKRRDVNRSSIPAVMEMKIIFQLNKIAKKFAIAIRVSFPS